MDRDKKDHRDTFDRTFIGSSGFMIILVLVIIIGSLIFNYFK
ncbi:ABC-type Na+ efflux pump permease subunit [Oceanobacillus polygoni]|uniref:ABC-type Na+ efflux pump permease subunit n=1 Tax=Oceanobacillus polygoni TaxID=1235259 RepID=A0A9X0Z0I4_9BACI|nr:ABC-type Na+ efflux pump permease subunit [Oceanobacillus polygoni]